MKLFKNMEVVLMLAFGIVCATVALRPAVPGNAARAGDAANTTSVARIDERAPTPEVHIVGRRLTPDEKRAGANSAG
jgi:hypothetical protein